MAIEAVQREMASWDERPKLPKRRVRRGEAESIVYSIRLDREEVELLELEASRIGLRPTGYARNLIRVGLAAGRSNDLADVVDRLDQVVQELRSLIG